jgi:hypothetical protein
MRKLLFASLAAAALAGGVAMTSSAGAQTVVVEERLRTLGSGLGRRAPATAARLGLLAWRARA